MSTALLAKMLALETKTVGAPLEGVKLGAALGKKVGFALGSKVGLAEVGTAVGLADVGECVVGNGVGSGLGGVVVGAMVGISVGSKVGGYSVGMKEMLGSNVGSAEGCGDGSADQSGLWAVDGDAGRGLREESERERRGTKGERRCGISRATHSDRLWEY